MREKHQLLSGQLDQISEQIREREREMGGNWVWAMLETENSLWDSRSSGIALRATLAALVLLLLWHCACLLFSVFSSSRFRSLPRSVISSNPASLSISEIVSDADLKSLVSNLGEKLSGNEKWENVIEKRKDTMSYNAKCCKPKDGPLKYVSVTVFEDCSPELLRDFYMDNDYRKQWDKTLVEHLQLQVDETNGIETGRTIKKFPLLTPREYVLAWKLWEGNDKTFYCFIKECEHPLAPRQKKYVRVGFFRSGWRIRKVPGRNACEIKMVHQEDAGLNVELAKLAFAKGIWSYVCKMDMALRRYSAFGGSQRSPTLTAVTLIQKVPPGVDTIQDVTSAVPSATSSAGVVQGQISAEDRKCFGRPSKKLIAKGLLLLGGVICLSRGHTDLGAKVAMAYIFKKLTRRGAQPSQSRLS